VTAACALKRDFRIGVICVISTLVAKVMTDLWSWGGFFWAKIVWFNELSLPHVRWGRNIWHSRIITNFDRIKIGQLDEFRISMGLMGRNLRCNWTNTCDGLNKHLYLFDPKWVCPNKNCDDPFFFFFFFFNKTQNKSSQWHDYMLLNQHRYMPHNMYLIYRVTSIAE